MWSNPLSILSICSTRIRASGLEVGRGRRSRDPGESEKREEESLPQRIFAHREYKNEELRQDLNWGGEELPD
jgi:hypothetical protein